MQAEKITLAEVRKQERAGGEREAHQVEISTTHVHEERSLRVEKQSGGCRREAVETQKKAGLKGGRGVASGEQSQESGGQEGPSAPGLRAGLWGSGAGRAVVPALSPLHPLGSVLGAVSAPESKKADVCPDGGDGPPSGRDRAYAGSAVTLSLLTVGKEHRARGRE